MGEIFQLLIKNGHQYHDLKNVYSVDEVYMFYERCLKIGLDSLRDTAIMTANSVAYASPAQTKKGAQDKHNSWKRYINSLDWETIINKSTKTIGGFLKMFSGLKIPTKAKSSDEIKKGDL